MYTFTQTQKTSRRGFTLIETIVAVAILVIAIVVPLRVMSQANKSAELAEQKLTAAFLLNEGISLLKQRRDNVMISSSEASTWLDALPPVGARFSIDAHTKQIVTCSSANVVDPCTIFEDADATSGLVFTHNNSNEQTVFVRSLKILNTDTKGAQIEATVTWTSSFGDTSEIAMRTWFSYMYP